MCMTPVVDGREGHSDHQGSINYGEDESGYAKPIVSPGFSRDNQVDSKCRGQEDGIENRQCFECSWHNGSHAAEIRPNAIPGRDPFANSVLVWESQVNIEEVDEQEQLDQGGCRRDDGR